MSVSAAVQYGTRKPWAPSVPTLRRWAAAGLDAAPRSSWIGIRIVDTAESRKLNRRYRHQDKPTNVLSFEAEPVRRQGECFLGDLVICAPVVAREARAQGKPLRAHWAHMVIHGTLHLLGFDHQRRAQAELMEAREARLLAGLGFRNPYEAQAQ